MKTVPNLHSEVSVSGLDTEHLIQTDFFGVLCNSSDTSKNVQISPLEAVSSERVYCQYCEDTDPNCMFCKGAHI